MSFSPCVKRLLLKMTASQSRSRLLLFLMLLFLFVLFNLIIESNNVALYSQDISESLLNDETKVGNGKHFDGSRKRKERWIVITTISAPTQDIKEMAAFKDWTIVVVADKKTPKSWSFPNCHFLSIEDQMKLDYGILLLIPFNSYTRKMIGYLYAIENGAKFIYDTDDDNLPIKRKLHSFDYTSVSSSLVYKNQGKSSFFNVYSHFGRSDIWPRGFPLEEINEEVLGTNFHLCTDIPTPTIQQGLVNQDADVDAVYRMIYVKNKSAGLSVEFDDVAPPVVIGDDTYVPFNSQNTLFNYGAFWALMLPTTVTFRVTDIWRGYIAKRLLQLCNQTLAFYGGNARQNRNPHNYHADFIEELGIYTNSSKMIDILKKWTCRSPNFVDCVLSLADTMTNTNLWQKNDYLLTKAWLADLKKIGYTFPEMSVKRPELKEGRCTDVGFVSITEKKTRPFEVQLSALKTLNRFCRPHVINELQFGGFSDTVYSHTKNVVLIVTFNHDHFGPISLLQAIYDPWFANVVFCGSFPEGFQTATFPHSLLPSTRNYSYINLNSSELHYGYYGYMCLNRAAQMGMKGADGFLVISDDMLLNFWTPYDLTKVHMHNACNKVTVNGNGWQWWNSSFGEPALKSIERHLITSSLDVAIKEELKNILMIPIWCASDIYYVPQKMMPDYLALSQLFFEHGVFLEIAVPKMLSVLGWSNMYKQIFKDLKTGVDFEGKYLWGLKDRGNPFNHFDKNDIFLHPVKMTLLDQRSWRSGFCNTYISSLFQAVSKRQS